MGSAQHGVDRGFSAGLVLPFQCAYTKMWDAIGWPKFLYFGLRQRPQIYDRDMCPKLSMHSLLIISHTRTCQDLRMKICPTFAKPSMPQRRRLLVHVKNLRPENQPASSKRQRGGACLFL